VGEINADNQIEVIGFGEHPSRGLKRGMVVNIESTVQSIQRAIEEAELMAGCEIRSTYTGIGGAHIRGLNSHGIVAIRDREVSQYDIDRVIDAAKAVAIPADQQILHVLPQEFVIDRQEGVREPVGMSGVRLEAKVHIVTGATSAAQNVTKCVRRCELDVGDVVLQQLASSYAVLTEDEKELGVCMVDMGAGTTDIAIFIQGAIRYTSSIPIAGDHVTADIAVAFRTPTQAAEKLKIEHGCAMEELIDAEKTIQIPSASNRPPTKIEARALAHVVHARYEELLDLIQAEIQRSGFEDFIPAGMVLTGGASHVPGLLELAEKKLGTVVRLGLPQQVAGLIEVRENPSFSTGVGLLLHGLQIQQSGLAPFGLESGSRNTLWTKVRQWFQGNF